MQRFVKGISVKPFLGNKRPRRSTDWGMLLCEWNLTTISSPKIITSLESLSCFPDVKHAKRQEDKLILRDIECFPHLSQDACQCQILHKGLSFTWSGLAHIYWTRPISHVLFLKCYWSTSILFPSQVFQNITVGQLRVKITAHASSTLHCSEEFSAQAGQTSHIKWNITCYLEQHCLKSKVRWSHTAFTSRYLKH